VEGNIVDWIVDVAIPGGNPLLGVQTSNLVLQRTAWEDSIAPTVHSGREGQVEVEVQEKVVALIFPINDDTIGTSAEV
jgi:hypothetical protein